MRRTRTDRGSGVLSATFGVAVFLVLLTFAAHVLVGMWTRSTVDAVAGEAATRVALSEAGDLPATRFDALADARAALGRHAGKVHMEFEPDPSGATVVLRVRSQGVGLIPGLRGFGEVDRRIVVRRELP